MQGFGLDDQGDILITDNKIELVFDADLTCQKVKNILNTNKGEWPFDDDEGVAFSTFLGKDVDEDMCYVEILEGLAQVDDSFEIEEFDMTRKGRKESISFRASNDNNEIIEEVMEWD